MITKNSETTRRRFLGSTTLAALTLAAGIRASAAPAAKRKRPQKSSGKDQVKVAVITGGHLFDVPNFHRLFRALPGVDAYIQPMLDFAATPPKVRDEYDVVLFYIMLRDDLTAETLPRPQQQAKAAIERLMETGQGIVLMHHAILAYPTWPLWTKLVGIDDRKFTFDHDQKVRLRVADKEHAITRGVQDWEMIDETYGMSDPGPGSHVLLTTDHPKSMKTIAWTLEHDNCRVFCTQSGHDNQTWVDPNFREVTTRGIRWVAGTI